MADPTAKLEVAFGVSASADPDNPSAPTVVSVGTVAAGTGAVTPGAPAGSVADDIWVVIVESDAVGISVPAGYDTAPHSPGTDLTDNVQLHAIWKRVDNGETAPTIAAGSNNHKVARIICIRGCPISGSPWDVDASSDDNTSSTSASIPGATTTGPNRLVLLGIGDKYNVDGTAEFSGYTNANLTGLTEQMDNSSAAGIGGALGLATGVKATAGSYGTTAVTLAHASRKAMWSGALLPNGWTDITTYLRQIDVNRGRQLELDVEQAGTMQLILDNADQRFDTDYTAGPYYPYVVSGVHIRLSITNVSTTKIFRGFTTTWTMSYPSNGMDAIVTLPCVDAFRILANLKIADSQWERKMRQQVVAGTPKAWFRLTDAPGAKAPTDSGPTGYSATAVGTPTFGNTGLLPWSTDAETSVSFGKLTDYIIVNPAAGHTANNWTLVFIMRRDGPPTSSVGEQIFDERTGGDNAFFIGLTNTGQLAPVLDLATLIFAGGGVANVCDGNRHVIHVVRSYSGGVGALTTYVDGVQDSTLPVNNAGTFTPNSVWLGNQYGGNLAGSAQNFQGDLQEVVIYDNLAMSASDIATQAGWALTPFSGYDVDGAITDALTDAAWPSFLTDMGTAASMLQAHALGGFVLDYVQRLMETEEGLFYVSKDGKVTFRGRDQLVTSPLNASSLTFSNDGVGGHCPFTDPVIDPGDTRMYNSARMTRDGGATFYVSDATSIAKNFERTFERSQLLHSSDAEAIDHANWIVSRFKNPRTLVSALSVNLANPNVDIDAVLGLELGSLVTIVRQHPGGTATTTVARIEGITHSSSVNVLPWIVTFQFSAWDSTIDQPWLLNDATYGVLGTTTRMGF